MDHADAPHRLRAPGMTDNTLPACPCTSPERGRMRSIAPANRRRMGGAP
jgi:hypothetical protein